MEKDPDRRIQEAIRLVFDRFVAIGSVRQTLLWFLEHGLQLPACTPRGEVHWKRPSYGTVYQILTNPVYGGTYAYGKTERSTRYEGGELRQCDRRKPREQWLALIPEAHEGYVSWEEFERIQRMIGANVPVSGQPGAAKKGAALLAGLLRCRRCASKLTVHYTGHQHDVLRYACHRAWLDKGQPRCIAFSGRGVDAAIAREVLRVVQPAAIEAAILAREEDTKKQDDVLAALQRDLQAARYAAQRAQKQYDAADPENRLVADELERRWNHALQRVRELERRIEQQVPASDPSAVPGPEEFADLATHLEAVWTRPDVDVRLKKRIIRTLIHEVVVDVAASEVVVVIHWKGGPIPKSVYRGGAVRTARRRRKRQSMPLKHWRASAPIH